MTKRNEVAISNRVYHKKKRDNEIHFRFTMKYSLLQAMLPLLTESFQKLSYLLLVMQFKYKIKLIVNIIKNTANKKQQKGDAIWIQNKIDREHKKKHTLKKKQQKDDQNRAKYLQEGRFSTPIGSNKHPKLPTRNANWTILKNRYILCLPISTEKIKTIKI